MSVVPGLKRSDTLAWVSMRKVTAGEGYLRSRCDGEEAGTAETGDEAEEEEDAHTLGCSDGDIEDGE